MRPALIWLEYKVKSNVFNQRRIFIFGPPGYFKLGALLEALRRLITYKFITTRARYVH